MKKQLVFTYTFGAEKTSVEFSVLEDGVQVARDYEEVLEDPSDKRDHLTRLIEKVQQKRKEGVK